MSRYLIVAAVSFTALHAVAGFSVAGEQARPSKVIEVAQAPEAQPPEAGETPDGGQGGERRGKRRDRGGDGPAGEAPPVQEAQPPPPPAPPPAQEAQPPAAAPPPAAQSDDNERGERRGGRGRGRGDDGPGREGPPPVREAQPPPPPAPPPVQEALPPAAAPPPAAQSDDKDRGERRGGRGRDRGADGPGTYGPPPVREAQPPAPPPAPPSVQEAQPPAPPPPVQQVQPPAAPTPPSAAQTKDKDRGERRGGDRRRREPEPAQQAQPPTPPAPPQQQVVPQQPPQAAPPPAAGAPPAPAPGRDRRQFGGAPGSIDEVKRGRRQRIEGKRTIIEEKGGRTIVQEKGAPPTIRHDEGERLRRTSRDVRTERRPDGGNLTIAIRPGGIEVFSEFDSSGRLQRRYRRGRDGRETNLIDNRRFRGGGPVILFDLRPPVLRMPRERYIVDYDRASDDDIYDALWDGPIERLDRGYSLEEIRYNSYLRDRMRRIDLDTVNFEFGAWQVPYDQYRRLERIANAINRVLDRRSDEIFLIEGHTDAVGSDIDNLTLSDRRAEEVAIILTETFGVPPENLVTQGYGEEFLKIPTLRAERLNRRVAVRRITPLLARNR